MSCIPNKVPYDSPIACQLRANSRSMTALPSVIESDCSQKCF